MASPEIALLLELALDLKKDIGVIKEDTSKNTITLEEHERRSTASEARLALLERRNWMIDGFFKISIALVGLTSTIIAIVAAIRHL